MLHCDNEVTKAYHTWRHELKTSVLSTGISQQKYENLFIKKIQMWNVLWLWNTFTPIWPWNNNLKYYSFMFAVPQFALRYWLGNDIQKHIPSLIF